MKTLIPSQEVVHPSAARPPVKVYHVGNGRDTAPRRVEARSCAHAAYQAIHLHYLRPGDIINISTVGMDGSENYAECASFAIESDGRQLGIALL